MKPRFFLFAAALAFAAVIFAGCEKDNEEPEKNENKPAADTIAQSTDTTGLDTIDNIVIKVGSPFSKPVIDKFLPTDKSTSADAFEKPQIVLNVPLNVDTAIDTKSVFRISVVEFTLAKADGANVQGTFSNSSDGLSCFFNMPEPYENGASYKAFVKVGFEQKTDDGWVIIKDGNGNNYYEEQTTEFTAGNRTFTFNPEHVLYAYPADRQYNFLPKETNEAYLILDFDYTFLFNEYKSKGYEQKIRITPFGGETTTVDFTYKTLTNGSGSAEIDYSVDKLNLANKVIYHLALVNIAKDSSATDASVPYEIYSIDFRTSSYNTFPEKINNFNIEEYDILLSINNVYTMFAPFVDNSCEVFDDYEYNYDRLDRCMLRLNAVLDECEWYKEKIAPLIYENADLRDIVGDITPPTEKCAIGFGETNRLLGDDEVKTGFFLERNNDGCFNWNCSYYIYKDFEKYKDILSKYTEKPLGEGAVELLNTEYLPSLIRGYYPIKIEYVLPGKNIITTTLTFDWKL